MEKVLFIITKSESGGAQKWVKEQIDLLGNSFDVFLACDQQGWLSNNVKFRKALFDNRIKKFSFSYLIKLRKFILCNDIKLIIASSANAGLYGRLVKLFCSVKTIYVAHGWSAIYNGGRFGGVYINIEKFLALLTDSILCVSTSDFRKGRDIIKINTKKFKLLQNRIMPVRSTKLSTKFTRPKVLCVARFQHPKRQDLLIDAVKGLQLDLFLVGDGPSREQLNNVGQSNVFFLGEIEGFQDFEDYDIFALISDSEGLPMSAIEAMSVGLPLVLSNVCGCAELISGNGILFENNILSIRDGMLKVLSNHDTYSKQSQVLFTSKFDLREAKFDYEDYYNSVIGM
jgi:glycosyltransferase involved in cell wall biosynthesis